MWLTDGGIRYLPGIAGFRAGVAFVTGVGVSALGERGAALATAPADRLRQIDGLRVPGGLHCSPAAHASLETLPTGTVRASVAHLNTRAHAEALVSAVRAIGRNGRARP